MVTAKAAVAMGGEGARSEDKAAEEGDKDAEDS
jgi:hypothetical protein